MGIGYNVRCALPPYATQGIPKEEAIVRWGIGPAYQVKGWHGSPYAGPAKEGFKAEKIGTGEGAQAFGWGIYVTDLEDIAKEYAKTIPPDKFRGRDIGNLLDNMQTAMNRVPVKSPEFRKLQEKNQVIEAIALGYPKNRLLDIFDNDEYLKATRKLVADLEDKEVGGRNLYKVTLHKGKKPSE